MFARTPSCLLGNHTEREVQPHSAEESAPVQGLKVMRVFSGSLLLYVQGTHAAPLTAYPPF